MHRLVVIRSDDQRGIGTGFPCILRQPQGFFGIVRAGSGNDLYFSGGGFDGCADDPFVFVERERRRLAGRSGGNHGSCSRLNLEFDLLLEGVIVDAAVLVRRNDGNGKTGKFFGSGGHSGIGVRGCTIFFHTGAYHKTLKKSSPPS